VAKQLNALLSTEQQQRKRYRNALSDLAHSLKTPLAVIQSQKGLSDVSIEQIDNISNTIGHQLKKAQTMGNNAWHLGIKVSGVSNKLLRTLGKIYPNIDLTYALQHDSTCTFHGDESDLTEILGNLLDNACKAAKTTVSLSIFEQNNHLLMIVEDDGPRIVSSQQPQVLQRGKRADSYAKGHGIGLAIVGDLVASYEGSLDIATSGKLGGAKFTLSFMQH
jgi:two-component system sensor histidine kinase PhoQ